MNLNGKTLIILSPAFPADESEEQSPWLPAKQALIRSLNRNFPMLEIIVLSFQFPAEKAEYLWHGNHIISFGGMNKRRGRNLILWYKVFRKLIRLRKKKKIAGIISFWCAECCLVGSYFGRLYSIRHLCWISGLDAARDNKFVKRIRPKPEELAVMSDFLAGEFYKNHCIHPKYLIPDAIDTSLFPGDQAGERIIDLLGAGNLVSLKQYDIFVQVVSAIKDQYPGIQAMLCGSGPEEQPLKARIKHAGLENTLCLTGLLPHKEVLGFMSRTRIFLHTSGYEGFGNVCIEALYAGAHVISFTRPMKAPIPHWHIVADKDEMIKKALDILRDKHADYTPVLPFDMNDSARSFIDILN